MVFLHLLFWSESWWWKFSIYIICKQPVTILLKQQHQQQSLSNTSRQYSVKMDFLSFSPAVSRASQVITWLMQFTSHFPPAMMQNLTYSTSTELFLYSQKFGRICAFFSSLNQQVSNCTFVHLKCLWPQGCNSLGKSKRSVNVLCYTSNRRHLPLHEKTMLEGTWTLLYSIQALATLILNLCTRAFCCSPASKSTKSA